jgi:hypothetical protein
MPVKLNKSYVPAANISIDTERKTGSTPDHFAAHIEFYDGSFTILPIALHLLTSRPQPFEEATPGMLETDKALLPWDKNTRPELQDTFKGMPLLNMCDSILMVPTVTHKSKEKLEPDTFLARAYSNVWLMKPSLLPGDSLLPGYYGYSVEEWRPVGRAHYGYARVSSFKYIAEYLFDNGSRVQWVHKLHIPRKPFSSVRLEHFKTIPAYKQAFAGIEAKVDGRKSCSLYFDCTFPCRDDTAQDGLCDLHWQRMMDLLSKGEPLSAKDLPEVQKADEIVWGLHLNDNNAAKIRERLSFLLDKYAAKKIWVVDFEGLCVVKGDMFLVHP